MPPGPSNLLAREAGLLASIPGTALLGSSRWWPLHFIFEPARRRLRELFDSSDGV